MFFFVGGFVFGKFVLVVGFDKYFFFFIGSIMPMKKKSHLGRSTNSAKKMHLSRKYHSQIHDQNIIERENNNTINNINDINLTVITQITVITIIIIVKLIIITVTITTIILAITTTIIIMKISCKPYGANTIYTPSIIIN